MTAVPTRTSLRKREPPTMMLLMHRNALISRVTKRQRNVTQRLDPVKTARYKDDDVQDTLESESDSDDDYVERRRRKRRSRSRRAASSSSTHLRRVAEKSTNDKALTFLQNAREYNIPVRSGKWNEDEENYLRELVHYFVTGVLDDVEQKLSMRSWLAKMLNCCPMRISKKQLHGEKFKGKCKYSRDIVRIERMTQKEYENSCTELQLLRFKFLKTWAKEEFARWSNASADFDGWYANVLKNVPKPTIARNKRLVPLSNESEPDSWESIHKALSEELRITREAQARTKNATLATRKGTRDGTTMKTPPGASQMIDFGVEPELDLLEPTPSPELEADLEAGTFGWELVKSASAKSPTPPSSPDDCQQRPSPTLVLDFGPPSMWNADQTSADIESSGCSDWVDDFIGDDLLLAFDPALTAPIDLSSSHWLQQINTTFQLS